MKNRCLYSHIITICLIIIFFVFHLSNASGIMPLSNFEAVMYFPQAIFNILLEFCHHMMNSNFIAVWELGAIIDVIKGVVVCDIIISMLQAHFHNHMNQLPHSLWNPMAKPWFTIKYLTYASIKETTNSSWYSSISHLSGIRDVWLLNLFWINV